MSFFGIIQDSTVGDYGEEHITKLELKEVSVVFFGANKKALVETIKQSVNMLNSLQDADALNSVTEHIRKCVDCVATDTEEALRDTCDTTVRPESDSIDVNALPAKEAGSAKSTKIRVDKLLSEYLTK